MWNPICHFSNGTMGKPPLYIHFPCNIMVLTAPLPCWKNDASEDRRGTVWGESNRERRAEGSLEVREKAERTWEKSLETEAEGDAEREGEREVRKEAAGCAIGHNDSPSPLTSMCHLTVLQIRLHMLSGDVRTYILMVGLNLHWSSLVICLKEMRLWPEIAKENSGLRIILKIRQTPS